MEFFEWIHVPTLFFITAIFAVFYVILQPIALWLGHGIPGIKPWTTGNLACGLGAILILGRSSLPPFLSVVLGNMLLLSGFCLIYSGIRIHYGKKKVHWFFLISILAVFFFLVVYFTYRINNISVRGILFSAFFGSMSFLVAYESSGAFKTKNTIRWTFTMLMGMNGLYSFIRGYLISTVAKTGDILTGGLFIRETLLETLVFIYTISIAFVLMLTLYFSEKNKDLAEIDSLTGVNNRRVFLLMAEQERSRSIRKKSAYSILSLDIDHFKQVNDNAGHAAGDYVLKKFAESLKAGLRASDCIGRLGGDEFVILLPDTRLGEAVSVAEKVRRMAEGLNVEFNGKQIPLTASLGISWNDEGGESVEEVSQEADVALYNAKRAGRNRVMAYVEPTQNLEESLFEGQPS